MEEGNVFRLGATTPAGSFAHGSALAYASAEATAEIHRGIGFALGFDLEGRLSGSLGDKLAASLNAAAALEIGIAVQAGVPIDLFDPAAQAGMLARFRAQAAASASVAAKIELTAGRFTDDLDDRFSGVFLDLLQVFLDETSFEAGVWGRAAFSAEIYGEMVFAGSLLPSALGGAGFTFSGSYGAGLGYGAGWEAVANMGFKDPARMLERMSDVVTDKLLAAVDDYMTGLAAPDATAARTARAILATVLPVSTRSLVRIGVRLSAGGGVSAGRSAVEAFLTAAREQTLRGVVDLAVEGVTGLFDSQAVMDRLTNLTAEAREFALRHLEELRSRIVALEELESGTSGEWLEAVAAFAEAMNPIVESDLLPATIKQDTRERLAHLWAASVLAHRLLESADRDNGNPFGNLLTPLDETGSQAQLIAATVGVPLSSLNAGHLVQFLTGLDLDALLTASPQTAGALRWVAEAVGQPPAQLINALLVESVALDAAAVELLLGTVTAALAKGVRQQVIPQLLDPLRARDRAIGELIEEFVIPTLVALPEVVLPAVAGGINGDELRRTREVISAVLLQSLSRYALASGDVLLSYGLKETALFLDDMGDRIGAFPDELGLIAAVAGGSVLPFAPFPEDIADLLHLAADVLKKSDEELRTGAFEAAGAVVALGIGRDLTRAAALRTLADQDAAPNVGDLTHALDTLKDGSVEIAKLVLERAAKLVLMHYWRVGTAFAEALYEIGKKIVTAVVAAAKWVTGLEDRAKELLKAVSDAIRAIARKIEELANGLRDMVHELVNDIRDAGWSLLEPLIEWAPEWAQEAAHDVYNRLFDGVEWLLALPAVVLGKVAGWVQDCLTVGEGDEAQLRAELTSADPEHIREQVRASLLNSGAGDVEFEIHIPIKYFPDLHETINFSEGAIGNVIAAFVAKQPVYEKSIEDCATLAADGLRDQAQAATASQKARNSAKVVDDAALLAPGLPLRVRFISPEEGALLAPDDGLQDPPPTEVRIRIDGANKSFVQPTLGVPARVQVQVNGRTWRIPADQWVEEHVTVDGKSIPIAIECRLRFNVTAPKPMKRSLPPHMMNNKAVEVLLDLHGRVDPNNGLKLEGAGPGGGTTWPMSPAVLEAAGVAGRDPASFGSEQIRVLGYAASRVRPIRKLDTTLTTKSTQVDRTGCSVVTGQPGLNVIQIAVSDSVQAASSELSNSHHHALSVFLQTPVRVEVTPKAIPLGVETEVTVTAINRSGQPVAGGRVFIEGKDVGAVGAPFRHVFEPMPLVTRFLFGPASTGSGGSRPGVGGRPASPAGRPPLVRLPAIAALLEDRYRTRVPAGEVRIPGSPVAAIPFAFVNRPAPRSAEYVAITAPTYLHPGERASVTVRMRNTGTLTWKAEEEVKLGSQSPQDNETWGVQRVRLPRPVAPGQEAIFIFDIQAPADPGTYLCQWQMVQENVAWFGDPTPIQGVFVAPSVKVDAIRVLDQGIYEPAELRLGPLR